MLFSFRKIYKSFWLLEFCSNDTNIVKVCLSSAGVEYYCEKILKMRKKVEGKPFISVKNLLCVWPHILGIPVLKSVNDVTRVCVQASSQGCHNFAGVFGIMCLKLIFFVGRFCFKCEGCCIFSVGFSLPAFGKCCPRKHVSQYLQ